MLIYIVKRLLWLIPIILCVAFIIFALLDMAPGSIVDSMISEGMTEEDVQLLKAQYDLDKSMTYRYGKYMLNLCKGDLGRSTATGRLVWTEFMERFPKTLELSLLALIVGVVPAIPLGVFAAKRASTVWDNMATVIALLGISVPNFWLAIMLMILFSSYFRLLPVQYDGTFASYILPVVCTAFGILATTMRQTRSAMLENIRADYLRTARAKGIPERVVLNKHALGNSLIPIITTIGNNLSRLLVGSVIVETVFGWPGVGSLLVSAITRRDTTLACGCAILTCIVYVVLLLLVDLAYAFVDPRIRSMYSSEKRKSRRKVSA